MLLAKFKNLASWLASYSKHAIVINNFDINHLVEYHVVDIHLISHTNHK
jgi:hypothetical protein